LGQAPGRLLGWFVGTTLINFSSMAYLVVGVNLAAFLVLSLLVGTIAKRLIFGETAHADPNGFFLRFYLKRSQAGFEDCAHCQRLNAKDGSLSSQLLRSLSRAIVLVVVVVIDLLRLANYLPSSLTGEQAK
jgi:hypothetical protein